MHDSPEAQPASPPAAEAVAPPRVIAWELTRRCPLRCVHCRAGADAAGQSDELSPAQCRKVLASLAPAAGAVVIFTGGEPLLREDLYDLAARAAEMGLRPAVATCGAGFTETTARRLLDAGVRTISVSIDGPDAASHDAVRGVGGAFQQTCRAVQWAREAGLGVQVNSTLTADNAHRAGDLLALAVRLGAGTWNPFFLVPTGRGRDLAGRQLSPARYERALHWLAGQSDRDDIAIRVTCAPPYQRVLRQTGRAPRGHGGGCLGGRSFAFISHSGAVQICGFLDVPAGQLGENDYDFLRVWRQSPLLNDLRDRDRLVGRCGACEYRAVCGGCRARAHAAGGDLHAAEPYCPHRPAVPLDETDRALLAELEAGFPLDGEPYQRLAERLAGGAAMAENASADDLADRTAGLIDRGVVRRLGPIFDSRGLGYTTALVAAAVPEQNLDELAEAVNALPGVSHNYLREGPYNLWFTLAARSREQIARTLADLRQRTGLSAIHEAPALRRYKLRVAFSEAHGRGRQGGAAPAAEAPPAAGGAPGQGAAEALDAAGRQLIRALRYGLPAGRQPFAQLAERLGRDEDDVLATLRRWQRAGIVRRLAAVTDPRAVGIVANGMAVFRLEEDAIDAAGEHLAAQADVTHAYRRPPLEGFDFNLYAMLHGRRFDAVRQRAAELAEAIGCRAWDVLFSLHEYKKEPMAYFDDASGE